MASCMLQVKRPTRRRWECCERTLQPTCLVHLSGSTFNVDFGICAASGVPKQYSCSATPAGILGAAACHCHSSTRSPTYHQLAQGEGVRAEVFDSSSASSCWAMPAMPALADAQGVGVRAEAFDKVERI